MIGSRKKKHSRWLSFFGYKLLPDGLRTLEKDIFQASNEYFNVEDFNSNTYLFASNQFVYYENSPFVQIANSNNVRNFHKKTLLLKLKLGKSKNFNATTFRKNPFNEMSFLFSVSVLDLTIKLYITLPWNVTQKISVATGTFCQKNCWI